MNGDTTDPRPADHPAPVDHPAPAGHLDPADCVAEADLIGAADIVAAFTALRHELKLQVRAGRDLATGLPGLVDGCLERRLAALTGLADRLGRLETAVVTSARQAPAAGSDAIRSLASAIAEIEESLERSMFALAAQAESFLAASAAAGHDASPDAETGIPDRPDPAGAWDACLDASPWLVRVLAAGLVRGLRRVFDAAREHATADGARRAAVMDESLATAAAALADTGQGLELALVRTRRLMQQAGVQRIDTLHEPFDAERMRAIDVVEDPTVPEGYVAEQYRPGYLLHGGVLRPAEVRVSRRGIETP